MAHRALTGTGLVMEEGVEACAQSSDLGKWPDAYRVGLISGLVINADGEFDANVWAIKQLAPLAASITNPAGVLAETARKAMRAVPSARVDNDATRQELMAAMPEYPRISADAQPAWKELRERIEIPF